MAEFNSFGSRRGNHEVMIRGTFGNIRLRNAMVPGSEGSWTVHVPSGEKMSIHEAVLRYQRERTPLVVIAGSEYGSGSSRVSFDVTLRIDAPAEVDYFVNGGILQMVLRQMLAG